MRVNGMMWLLALGVIVAACNKSNPADPTVPAKMVMLDGQPQTGAVGAVAAAPLRVRVDNAANDPVAGVTVTWAVTSGGGATSVTTQETSAAGVSSVNFTYGQAGPQVITASVPGLSGSPQTFTLTAVAAGGGGGGGQ